MAVEEITENPYTFTIRKMKYKVKVDAKPIESGTIVWPTYTDTAGNTYLQSQLEVYVPHGIKVLYFSIDYQNSLPIAQFKLRDAESNVMVFDTVGILGYETENIGVTENSTYLFTMDNLVQVVGTDKGKEFRIKYSNDINKGYKVTVEDYKS